MVDKPVQRGTSARWVEIIPASTSAGAADAGRLIQLDANGKIDPTFLYDQEVLVMTASEAISANSLVNVHSSSGTKIRNANASAASTRADGFITSAVAGAGTVRVTLGDGLMSGLVGLTDAADYFLATVAGTFVTPEPALTTGQISQRIGRALSTTQLYVRIGDEIQIG